MPGGFIDPIGIYNPQALLTLLILFIHLKCVFSLSTVVSTHTTRRKKKEEQSTNCIMIYFILPAAPPKLISIHILTATSNRRHAVMRKFFIPFASGVISGSTPPRLVAPRLLRYCNK